MLLFDASTTSFRTVKLRPRNSQCVVCGDSPTIKELIDYEWFCNATATDKIVMHKILSDELCISTKVDSLCYIQSEFNNYNVSECLIHSGLQTESR